MSRILLILLVSCPLVAQIQDSANPCGAHEGFLLNLDREEGSVHKLVTDQDEWYLVPNAQCLRMYQLKGDVYQFVSSIPILGEKNWFHFKFEDQTFILTAQPSSDEDSHLLQISKVTSGKLVPVFEDFFDSKGAWAFLQDGAEPVFEYTYSEPSGEVAMSYFSWDGVDLLTRPGTQRYDLLTLDRGDSGAQRLAGDNHSLDSSNGSIIDALFVSSGGSVGIGTTFPSRKLQVVGNTDFPYVADFLANKSNSDGGISISNTAPFSTSNIVIFDLRVNSDVQERTAFRFRSRFVDVNDQTRTARTSFINLANGFFQSAMILEGEDVLIGGGLNIKPSARLDLRVNQNENVPALSLIQADIVNNPNAFVVNNLGSGLSMLINTPSRDVVVDRNGNLGVGTTNPGAALEVSGQIKITGGSPGQNKVLTSDGSGLATWESLGTLTTEPAGTNGQIQFNNNGNLGADIGLFWDNTFKRLGVNTTSPTEELEINGEIKITGGNPGVGKVLTSDANGRGTWQTVNASANPAGSNQQIQYNGGGFFAADGNFTFDSGTNTLSVVNSTLSGTALNTTDVVASTIQGTTSVRSDGGFFDGNKHALSLSGSSVFVGDTGLNGSTNTFIGDDAGLNNTVGSGNVLIGSDAGRSLNDSNNTMIGTESGESTTSGDDNVFIGETAGQSNISGSNNTYIGTEAGRNSTGRDNVFIGFRAGQNETGDDKLYISNSNTSIPLIYGDFDDDIVIIRNTLGVGKSDPLYAVDLPNLSSFFGQGRANAWTHYSSIRWKEKVETVKDPIQVLQQIRGVSFDWKQEYGGGSSLGFVAEEVGEVLPELVDYEANGRDAESMNYMGLIPVLVEALKQQQATIEDLQSRLNAMEQKQKNPN